jgi:hypothetical protein
VTHQEKQGFTVKIVNPFFMLVLKMAILSRSCPAFLGQRVVPFFSFKRLSRSCPALSVCHAGRGQGKRKCLPVKSLPFPLCPKKLLCDGHPVLRIASEFPRKIRVSVIRLPCVAPLHAPLGRRWFFALSTWGRKKGLKWPVAPTWPGLVSAWGIVPRARGGGLGAVCPAPVPPSLV